MPHLTIQTLMPKACEHCRLKRIKCDRIHPCANCKRSDIVCTFTTKKVLPRGRAGGRKPEILHLRDRVAKLESIIHQLQAKSHSESLVAIEQNQTVYHGSYHDVLSLSRNTGADQTCSGDGMSTFWTVLMTEITQLQDTFSFELQESALDGSVDEDENQDSTSSAPDSTSTFDSSLSTNLLVYPTDGSVLRRPHPPKQIRDELIAIFSYNVDPIFKIVHIPTLKDQANRLDTKLDSPTSSPADDAMLFAVYAAAVMSMTDTLCKEMFGQCHADAIRHFSQATQAALAAADLLKPHSLMMLQAFMLHLLVLRSIDSGQRQWALIALAVRLARGMNLHRVGPDQKMTMLDREMRCRVWHQLRVLEFRAALDRGDRSDIDEDSYTTIPMSNVRDEDLTADSFGLPVERLEITESTFSVLSQHCVTLCKRLNQSRVDNISLPKMEEEWAQKRRLIGECEHNLRRVFQFHCHDEYKTLQWYIKAVFGGLMPTFRIMYYRPLWQRSQLRPRPVSDNQLLGLAIDSLHRESLSLSSPAGQYTWHVWVQWYTLAVALAELCAQSTLTHADQAWDVVERSYARQSQHVADSENGKLWKPISELMKRARSVRNGGGRSSSREDHLVGIGDTVPIELVADFTQTSHGERPASTAQWHNNEAFSEDLTFSDDTWMLQQSIMDPDARDEAWMFWEGFVEELAGSQ